MTTISTAEDDGEKVAIHRELEREKTTVIRYRRLRRRFAIQRA
jgi:hypothetical protein